MRSFNLISQSKEYLYLLAPGDKLYKGELTLDYKANYEEKVDEVMDLLAEDVWMFFVIDCEKIFYDEISSDTTRYFDETNQQSKKIFDFPCLEMTSYGDRLYFTDRNGILKSSNYDGSGIEVIFEGFVKCLFPCDGYLYYCAKDDNHVTTIYRYDYHLKATDSLVSGYINNMVVLNNRVYYIESQNLYSYDINTKEIQAITEDGVVLDNSLNIYGDYIVYSNSNEGGNTFLLNTKTNRRSILSYRAYNVIFVAGNRFFTDLEVIAFHG